MKNFKSALGVLLALVLAFTPAIAGNGRQIGNPTNPDAVSWYGGGCDQTAGGNGISGCEIAIDYSGDILPTVTNAQTCGTSSLVWSNVYSTAFTGASGSFTGAISASSITDTSMTSGSVLFSTTSGVIAQDNANFSYKPTGSGGPLLTVTNEVVTGNAFSVGTSSFAVLAGKVGIGTASPASTLEVNGNAQVDGNTFSVGTSTLDVVGGQILMGQTSTGRTGQIGMKFVGGATSTSDSGIVMFTSGGAQKYAGIHYGDGATWDAWMQVNASSMVINGPNGSNNIVITSAGNTGINTTTPATILDVVSTTQGLGIPSLTSTQVSASTPGRAGTLIYNSSISLVCVSTGTTISGYARVSNATACQ